MRLSKKALFLANARGEFTDKTPVWIMRQAGRYLPDYRKIREQYTFEALARTPKAVAELSAQPVEIFDLDVAIVFSDILFILEPLGLDLTFNPGPILTPILNTPEQARQFKPYDPSGPLGFVADGLLETRKRIGDAIALLGFCGAPFTLFCYLCGIQGQKDFHKPLRFLLNYPRESEFVLDLLTTVSIDYLKLQLNNGADAVQIFDTWAGDLSESEYKLWAYPYVKRIVNALRDDNHICSVYVKNGYHLTEMVCQLDARIISIDWKTPLQDASKRITGKCLQGNLNPYTLLGPKEVVIQQANEILVAMKDRPGYIFNLGHGILPQTPVENVRALVDTVHAFKRNSSCPTLMTST